MEFLKPWRISLFFTLAGVIVSSQLRDFSEALLFLTATIGQFIAYVFVSRVRQRGSFFWHAIASIGSNGMWFITLNILNNANVYWLLFAPYVIGIIAGRLAGVNLAQLVENKYNLKADATRDPRLKPEERLNYIVKEPTLWVLVSGLLGYVLYSYLFWKNNTHNAILTVVGLGVLQNFFYALVTRASARGNSWYIATTGTLSGLGFYFSALFLISNQMDFYLIIPYILGTTLGSTIGAFISMIIEWTANLRPDAHLEKNKVKQPKQNIWKKKLPYVTILILTAIWILFHKILFIYIGYPLTQLKFPISIITTVLPRELVMIAAAIIFLLDSALHTVTSRAGNRNHTGYHMASLIPKGFSDFLKISYLSLNTHILDIVPVAILSSCLGNLYGKDVAEKTEQWLQARMDVADTKVTTTK